MHHSENPPERPTAVDLFSGCGGLTLGLADAGFDVLCGMDLDGLATWAYNVQFRGAGSLQPTRTPALSQDCTEVDPSVIPRYNPNRTDRRPLGLLTGGPSCQGFSQGRGPTDADPRNSRAFAMVEWAERLAPQTVLIENVTGLKHSHPGAHDALCAALSEAGPGYTVRSVSLDAAEYGVPQARERVFIVGVRADHDTLSEWTPDPTRAQERQATLGGNVLGPYRTAREALDDLPEPLAPQSPAEDPVHLTPPTRDDIVTPHACGEWIEREQVDGSVEEVKVPPNHVATDHSREVRQRFATYEHGYLGDSITEQRLAPDEPAPTVTVSSATPHVHYKGPTPRYPDGVPEDPDVRRLTVREMARLQTFPDWFCFAGSKQDQARQVGNAVPPLLGSTIAGHLYDKVVAPTGASSGVGSDAPRAVAGTGDD